MSPRWKYSIVAGIAWILFWVVEIPPLKIWILSGALILTVAAFQAPAAEVPVRPARSLSGPPKPHRRRRRHNQGVQARRARPRNRVRVVHHHHGQRVERSEPAEPDYSSPGDRKFKLWALKAMLIMGAGVGLVSGDGSFMGAIIGAAIGAMLLGFVYFLSMSYILNALKTVGGDIPPPEHGPLRVLRNTARGMQDLCKNGTDD